MPLRTAAIAVSAAALAQAALADRAIRSVAAAAGLAGNGAVQAACGRTSADGRAAGAGKRCLRCLSRNSAAAVARKTA